MLLRLAHARYQVNLSQGANEYSGQSATLLLQIEMPASPNEP